MTGLATLKPARRPELRLSGPLRHGPAVVHLVRDPASDRTYELGPKEHFVLAQLDGTRTLGEIGDAYAGRFGARLGDQHWGQLLRLLGGRRLLAGGGPPPEPAAPPRSTVLDGRVRLVRDPAGLVDRLHRATAPLLRRPALVALAGLLLAMLAVLAADAPVLLDGTGELLRQPAALVAVAVLLQLSTAAHELAHGLAGRAFGGSVTEIGLRWRLPVVYPYCTVADVQFLPRRWQQVTTAAAGALANLVFLLPFAAAWLLLPAGAAVRPALAGLLVLGVALAVANLMPLPPLDGYKMLGYGLGVARLAAGSRRFLGLALRRRPEVRGYPRALRLVYAGYGLFLVAVAAAAVAAGLLLLADRAGAGAAALAGAGLIALLVLWRAGLALRGRREETA